MYIGLHIKYPLFLSDFIETFVKRDIGDSQNTTKYLFVTAGIQDSNNYMFRPFIVAIIRLYIPGFKSIHNMPTRLCSKMRSQSS
jgi:hypothetical protein